MKTTQEVKAYLQEALERADEYINNLPQEEKQWKHAYQSGFYQGAIEQVIRSIRDEN